MSARAKAGTGLLAVLASFAVAAPASAQFANPGLNTPYNTSTHGFVADKWTEFTWPTYASPSLAREQTTKVEGDSSQKVGSNAAFNGGILQVVNVTPNQPKTISVRSIMTSTESGDFNVEVGIGVANGNTTNPNNIVASNFKWDNQIDLRSWQTFSVTMTPTGSQITVFLHAFNKWAFNTNVFFDDAQPVAPPPPPPLAITTSTLPKGIHNADYSQTLVASGGVVPYSWTISAGFLPHGLSLNSTNGTLSGFADTLETDTFTVQVSDSSVPTQTASKQYTLSVTEAGNLINPGVNGPYNQSTHGFVANGWNEFTWPTFASPDFGQETNTKLEGDSSQKVGKWAAWRGGVYQQVSIVPNRPFTAKIKAIMSSTESGDFNVEVGIGIAQGATTDPNNITVSDFKWDNQINLRTWNTFQVSLTPTQTQITIFLYAYNKWAFDTNVFFDDGFSESTVLRITTTPNAGVVGVPYSQQLQTVGGTAAITWSIKGDLPAGISLSSTGLLSGTPTESSPLFSNDRSFTSVVTATDSSNPVQTAINIMKLRINNSLTLLTATLPKGAIGQAYGIALDASGGNSPYSWTLIGSLPPGLSIDQVKGTIFGKPTQLGAFTFSAKVTDSTTTGGPATDQKMFTLVVGNIQLSGGGLPSTSPATVYNPDQNEVLVVYSSLAGVNNGDIFARRVDTLGFPVANEIPVAVSPTSNDANPSVAYSVMSEEYLVAYESNGHVSFVILDKFGTPITPPTRIDNSTGIAKQPVVVWRSSTSQNEFLVFWTDNRSGTFNLFSAEIATSGGITRPESLLRGSTSNDLNPAAAYNTKNDEAVILFSELGNILAVQVAGTGNSVLSTITLAGRIQADNILPDIAYETEMNRYCTVWQDGRNGTTNYDIYGQLLEANLALFFSTFAVDADPGNQGSPSVSYNVKTDAFFVAWEHQQSNGSFDIQGRAVSMLGGAQPLGDVTRLSTPTASPTESFSEFKPSLVTNSTTAQTYIAWEDNRNSLTQVFADKTRDHTTQLAEGLANAPLLSDETITNTMPVRVDLYDFGQNLAGVTLEFRDTQKFYSFSTFGTDMGFTSDREGRALRFDVPRTDWPLGESRWVIVTTQ